MLRCPMIDPKSEVFSGSLNFVQNFASITSPLWDLTGDVEWKWTKSEKKHSGRLNPV